jgi:arylsulfatase A-like enzyme
MSDGEGRRQPAPGARPEPARLDRRTFVKRGLGAGALALGGASVASALAGCGSSAQTKTHLASTPVRRAAPAAGAPNILVIVVDQMRTPVWPRTVPLEHALANIERIRDGGVSFANHYTAANDCSPSRSALLTGLYTHQTGCLITGGSTLDPGFPTWGSMLREQGYQTYWYGKWHLTRHDGHWTPGPGLAALERYGFSGGTYPSPDGGPGQGGRKDPKIATQFERWLAASGGDGPWCTTVSFVNPHDIAWWYAYTQRVPGEADPPPVSLGLAPNFETPQQLIERNKPSLQRSLQDTAAASFGAVPFEGERALDVWLPFMDLYAHLHRVIDVEIGRVLDALQRHSSIAENTVVIFTSDHGEYGSSHGLRGKGASAYDEALRVPLIVNDPRGKLVSHAAAERRQLSSSVDVAPLLLTIATDSEEWREQKRYSHIAHRLDLARLLRDPRAPGRDYVMHATDEIVTEFAVERYAYQAPRHVIAARTKQAKLATYSHWSETSTAILTEAQEQEMYDYRTHAGRLEIDNVAGSGALYTQMHALLAQAIDEELRRPLPAYLREAQSRGLRDYFQVAERNALRAVAARARRRANKPIPTPRGRSSRPVARAAGGSS